MRSDKTKAPIR